MVFPWAQTQCGDHPAAYESATRAVRHPNTNFWAPATLAVTLANLEREEEEAHEALG